MTKIEPAWTDRETTDIDFIIVGSGAGGAPLAARLAERDFRVLVIEMGPGKPSKPSESLVDCVDVPLLHSEATEDERHSLRYFVDHFAEGEDFRNPRTHQPAPEENDAINPTDEEGVFYPRSQGLGGCTIHNAMITICGPSEDWDEIADELDDPSWRGEKMRTYFERLENCHYDNPTIFQSIASRFGSNLPWKTSRHGDDGWLQTTLADLRLLINEKRFLKVVASAALTALDSGIETLAELKSGRLAELDPNHWEVMRRSQEGLTRIPCAITPTGERSSARDRLLGAQKKNPERLLTLTKTCVTKVVLEKNDDQGTVSIEAIGVEVLEKEHVYEADPNAVRPSNDWMAEVKRIFCRREVILCGGSFNTPQLLMLSGIGDHDHLKEHLDEEQIYKHLPRVGRHLQDRYEVPIVAQLTDRFKTLDDIQLTSTARKDPLLRKWRDERGNPQSTNVYATNGGLIGIFKRSSQETQIPDLFMFAVAGTFEGYSVGWSRPGVLAPETDPEVTGNPNQASGQKNTLTWLILKARSRNDTGFVRLRSNLPFRRPEINFQVFPDAFDEDLNCNCPDINAIVEGVTFIEKMLRSGKEKGLIESYRFAGTTEVGEEQFDSPDRFKRIAKWIKEVAWGHHACGTCRIGRSEEDSVVDGRFRVHGVQGLRIVDASVFPKIPGYFIATNIYMIAEKAADVVAEDNWDKSLNNEDHPEPIRTNLQMAPIYFSDLKNRLRANYPAQIESVEAELVWSRRKADDADV